MRDINEPTIYYAFHYALHHNELIRPFVIDTIKKEWDNLSWQDQFRHDLKVALGLTNMSNHYVAKNKEGLLDLHYFIVVQDALKPLKEYVKNM